MGQPGNALTNHFGVSSSWNSFSVSAKNIIFSSTLLSNIIDFVALMFKSGIIFTCHPFVSSLYLSTNNRESLPTLITLSSFSKFYRIRTVSNLRLNIKKKYVTRVSAQNLNLSSIQFVRLNNSLLVYLFASNLYFNFMNRLGSRSTTTSFSKLSLLFTIDCTVVRYFSLFNSI
jgi:hypothetical protein